MVKGARDEKDALQKFKESKENLLRPLVGTTDSANLVGLTNYLATGCGLEQWPRSCGGQRIRNPKDAQCFEC